jgi:hypothetical protein
MHLNNMKMLRVDICTIAEGATVLYGEGRGRKFCKALINRSQPSGDESLVALDFKGISHASASFLREGVLGYAAFLSSQREQSYMFAANMNEDTVEEFSLILRDRGQCFVAARLSSSLDISHVRILGLPEGQHSKTLGILVGGGELSVGEIRTRLPLDDRPAGTALNGRLEWLSERGLLASRQQGREKKYRFPFAGG